MTIRTRPRAGGGGPQMPRFLARSLERMQMTHPAQLIGLWPLDSKVGATVAKDYSTRGNDGAYTAVTLEQPGFGDGKTCALFDGAASFMQPPAAFRTAFNGQELSIAVWCRVLNAAVWADGGARRWLHFQVDANNSIHLTKQATANRLEWTYVAGATASQIIKTGFSSTDWFHMGLTASKSADQMIAYLNGVQEGAIQTGLGTFAGTLAAANTVIGADNATPTLITSGYEALVAVWTTPLSRWEIADLAVR